MKISLIIPFYIRRKLLQVHQNYIWRRVIVDFESSILNNMEISSNLIQKLIYGWGNQGWSAHTGFLESCIKVSLTSERAILECGSGLTTVIVGIIAKKKGLTVISLEHNRKWADNVNNYLTKLNLTNVRIQVVRIVDYDGYHWYDIKKSDIPTTFDMVICDGPPAQTQGGRYGLIPIMNMYFSKGTKILMDDTVRDDERVIIKKWKDMIPLQEEKINSTDLHSILTIL